MADMNFTPASLDSALASGVIRPDQHEALMSQMPPAPVGPMAGGYGAPSVAPDAPPPPAPVPAQPPPPAAAPFGAALGNAGMQLPPAQAPPVTSGPVAEPAPPPMAARPEPTGQVDVGKITQLNPTAPPPTAGAAPRAASMDPRMAALKANEEIDKKAANRALGLGSLQEQAAEKRAADAYGALAGAKEMQAKQAAQAATDEARDQKHRDAVLSEVNRVGQMKVDPNAFWNDSSGAQKVGNVISVLLGGIGMGIAGKAGQNPAMDALQRRIDQNIDAQKANIANAREGVAAKRGILADSISLTGSHAAGDAAARAMYWGDIQQQAIAEAAKMDPKMINANTQNALAEIQKRTNDARANLQVTMQREQASMSAAGAARRAAADKLKFEQGAKLEELRLQGVDAGTKRMEARTKAAGGGSPEIAYKKETEDNTYKFKRASLDSAAKQVTENLPYNGVTSQIGAAFNTDSHSQYKAGLQQFAKALQAVSGDSAEGDRDALLALAPQPNDDPKTIARKLVGVREVLDAANPNAAARAHKNDVQTVDAPSDQ